ncbi:MAG: ATP-binding protein [Cycloclasticus sp.]|nr:ATP-binding protein [Cycloclasticus sp.]
MDTKNIDYEIVSPGASAMIESLRAYGYSLNSAIADLLDNSITAHAKNVWIHMHWDGENSWLSIIDDGTGMDEQILINAMRPGSQNPLDERSEDDLGRFGLGLKTASFSQARSLTVASHISGGEINFRRWDLDYVGKHNEWRLLKTSRSGSEQLFSKLAELEHGSIVLLENMDRLCEGQNKLDESSRRKFMDRVSSLQAHLSMVFHRFMEGRNGINIYINGYDQDHKVRPWDPFLSNHIATQKQPAERKPFHDGVVEVEGYVLPHKDKLGPLEHGLAAGPNGWNDHQGFYVYRNKRLLVAGSWLGLGGRRHGWTKEEHYKLARIKIEIPNRMDSTWQIDVKKSTAIPPALAATWLENYAEKVRKEARNIFSHRGQYGSKQKLTEMSRLWVSGIRSGSQIYRINRDNKLVSDLLNRAGNLKTEIEVFFRLLEETVPVQKIWLDMAEHSERSNEPMGGLTEKQIMGLVDTTIKSLSGDGREPSGTTIEYVCNMEAYINYADVIRAKYLGVEN